MQDLFVSLLLLEIYFLGIREKVWGEHPCHGYIGVHSLGAVVFCFNKCLIFPNKDEGHVSPL